MNGSDNIEQQEELRLVKPERRTGSVKLGRRINKLANTALDTLEEVLTDDSVKAADRISAVKLTFDLLRQQEARTDAEAEGGTVRVVIEGIDRELCE